jgi:hypothetical protein
MGRPIRKAMEIKNAPKSRKIVVIIIVNIF